MRVHHPIFESIIAKCGKLDAIPTAIVYPLSEVALRGAMEAAAAGLIVPHLIGPRSAILRLADEHAIDIKDYLIVDVVDDTEAAQKGVSLCREGGCHALMKGSLHTDHFLQPVMNTISGLRARRRISHAFVVDVLSFPRPLLITDASINIYPTLEDKVDIIQNAIDLALALGVSCPKVAILSAIETVTSKIRSTIDAAALCKMADRAQIVGGILDGPLAFDDAMEPEAAKIKDIHSPVAGLADVLVVPDLESGNMLAKQLGWLGGAELAGVVLGARVPIILTSRADTAKTRLASAAIASLLIHQRSQTFSQAVIA